MAGKRRLMENEQDIEQGLADAQLVRQARKGDEGAFEALVRRYKSLMIVVAYRQCSNEIDAEDVAQEALYRAFRELHRLDNPARFKSWAMRITANAAIDMLRRRRPTVSLEDGRLDPRNIESGGAPVHQPAEQDELRRRIVEAIEALPEPYQLPAVLRYLENLPYRDIAGRMGLREDTLRKRIHRANQMLRQKLQPLMEEE
jgi:RNA polymerase sigma-70 factor (ECF subfamily)